MLRRFSLRKHCWRCLEKHSRADCRGHVSRLYSLQASQPLVGKIQNLRRTRDLLLPRLLSGQIEVEAIPDPRFAIRD
jgi:hypothetical protein